MKWLFIIVTFVIVACSGFAGEKKNQRDKKVLAKKITGLFSSFALLELFTSEGCSSCPPADKLLPQLASTNSNIIPLSFHVDYWNHLGWTDPFSNVEFSERQRKYADEFRLESIYTPQLVINGEYELVGSNRAAADQDIKKVLSEKPKVEIEIVEVRKQGGKLSISSTLTGDLDGTQLIAALVQKHAEMKVRAGENNGAHLSHTNVVRSFIQKPAQQKMNLEIEFPTDLAEDNCQLILYAQNKKDLKITGATVSAIGAGGNRQ